jgi:hypothetical protein
VLFRSVIFTVRRVYSGGWLNSIVATLALLCAFPIVWGLTRNCSGSRFVPILLLLPLSTSLCGCVFWAIMLLATRAGTFLLMPAAQVWAFALPSLTTAFFHIPATIAHKGIEDHLEAHLH